MNVSFGASISLYAKSVVLWPETAVSPTLHSSWGLKSECTHFVTSYCTTRNDAMN